MTHLLSSAYIFSPETSNFSFIKKFKYRFHFKTFHFCNSVEKGFKLKFRKFWELIPTFAKISGEKLEGGLFSTPMMKEKEGLKERIDQRSGMTHKGGIRYQHNG